MKVKYTRQEANNSNEFVLRVPYCDAQYLLDYSREIGYNRGLYGWNWDLYNVNERLNVCTGYRSLVGHIDSKTRAITKKWEEKAKKIRNNWDLKYEDQKRGVIHCCKMWAKAIIKHLENVEAKTGIIS
jgi:hypothetical protein